MLKSESQPTIRASIDVVDFGDDPELVTRELGIAPTRAGRKGEKYTNMAGRVTERDIQESYWSLHSGAGYRASVEAHIGALLQQLQIVRFTAAKLPGGARAVLRCTIIPDGALPDIRLSVEQMRQLAELGVPLELVVISVRDVPSEVDSSS